MDSTFTSGGGLRYLSVCSGIEAATQAWHHMGWTPVAFSEIDKFPAAVLAHHYPTVPNLGDMTKFQEWPDLDINLLVGGTPCQSFSVAGLRKGLADPRGNLMLTYLAIADRYQPEWLVWENVPGVLSSAGGSDFGTFLGALGALGYGFAYRVLDAQYFGVPQRRRRVFVVGHLGDWRRAAAVLFERHSLQGHPAPSREKREGIAPTISARTKGGGGLGTDFDCDGGLVANRTMNGDDVFPTLDAAHDRKWGSDQWVNNGFGVVQPVTHSLRAEGFDASEDGTGRGTPLVPIMFDPTARDPGWGIDRPMKTDGPPAVACMGHAGSHQNGGGHQAVMTLAIRGLGDSHNLEYREDGTANAILTPNGGRAGIGVGAVAFAQNTRDEVREMDVVGALASQPGMKQTSYIRGGMQVRRLTPRECERLQGFPDDFTLIPFTHGKPAADGPRYKALGNSMAVPVMRWIGERIELVDWLYTEAEAA